jgi:hypothetical protein
MKKSVETLTAICDWIAAGCSQSEAAKRCGVSVSSFWSWVKSSQQSPAEWQMTYCDSQMSFAEATVLARKICLHGTLSEFEARMRTGTEIPVYFQGRPQFKDLEAAVGLDEDTRELLGMPRDGLERDAQGNRIPLTLHQDPPIAGVIRLLSANFPKLYGEKSTVDINQRVNLGVTVVGRKPLPPPVIDITPIPAAAPRLIEKPVDGDWIEAEEDLADLHDGPEPEPPAEDFQRVENQPEPEPAAEEMTRLDTSKSSAAAGEIEPEEIASEPAPAPAPEPAPTEGRFGNLSPKQQQILLMLRAGVPANATTQPTGFVNKGTPS